MDESSICTIFKNSINNQGGICHKIPDPSSTFNKTIQRPFDGFGVFNGKPLYWEAKYSSSMKSFSLDHIEDHQIENLLLFKKLLPDSICLIVLGIHVDRGDTRLYLFDDIDYIAKRRENKQNILKKELEKLPYLKVEKSLVNINEYFNTN